LVAVIKLIIVELFAVVKCWYQYLLETSRFHQYVHHKQHYNTTNVHSVNGSVNAFSSSCVQLLSFGSWHASCISKFL